MLLSSVRATVLLLLLCCGVYPLAVTVLAQLAVPAAAQGSLLRADDGTVIGSSLIGQSFTSPAYLQGRPSASGYDAMTSGGSNYAVGNPRLAARRAEDRLRLERENPGLAVPEVLLTASGSGLDPEIPTEAARYQVPRIARARGLDPSRVESLLGEQELRFFGESRVNVLAFNLALDRRFGVAR